MPAMDTDEPYSLVGRTQTGEFNIYVGTGCVISQFNSGWEYSVSIPV